MGDIFRNPLPGVPVVESPFFERLLGEMELDPETERVARELHEYGYAVLRFPDPEIDEVAEALKEQLRPRYDWDGWNSGVRQDLRIQDAWQDNALVRRIAANERILSLLSTIYGRRAFPFQTLNFAVGTQQHFHTDSVHFSSMPERFMCGVWLALEDIGPDQGPLVYYPGSHRLPIYVNEHVGHTAAAFPETGQSVYHDLWHALVREYGLKEVRLTVERGTALIWAANLLHGGDHHVDRARTRWSQVTHYFFEDCACYTPMHSDPALGSVYFRDLVDVSTGERVPNRDAGHSVPASFIEATVPEWNRLPGFDPAAYLAANPDVAAAGVDPVSHWLEFGRYEGRAWAPSSDV